MNLLPSISLFADAGPWGWRLVMLGWSLLMVPVLGLVIYFLFSLPLRRQERTRLFIDLLDVSLAEGFHPEQAIVSISQSRERSVGLRFHQLAAYLEDGLRLSDGIARMKRWLPGPVRCMLRAGEEIGDLRAVLPACRAWVTAGTTQMWKAQHYLLLLVMAAPFTLVVMQLIAVFIWPKFREIMLDMDVPPTPSVAEHVIGNPLVIAFTALMPLVVFFLALSHIGGTQWIAGSHRSIRSLADWFAYALPWRRKRMQRDFSAMLAVLLDHGVPEDKAVELAAECADNNVFRQFAAQTRADLRQGVPLTGAVKHLDDAGEFRWRLANAAQSSGGFLPALRGWHEALEAKAFQQEQAATQLFTSGLVLANGLIVALLAVGVFQLLTNIINEGVLW